MNLVTYAVKDLAQRTFWGVLTPHGAFEVANSEAYITFATKTGSTDNLF